MEVTVGLEDSRCHEPAASEAVRSEAFTVVTPCLDSKGEESQEALQHVGEEGRAGCDAEDDKAAEVVSSERDGGATSEVTCGGEGLQEKSDQWKDEWLEALDL